MKNTYVKKLELHNYRNFSNFNINVGNNPILILGENGSGKTNILEAISLLFPGKGLRNVKKFDEICKDDGQDWSFNSVIETKIGNAHLNEAFDKLSNKRLIEFNGSKIVNSELSRLNSIVWLTPQMDNLFLESSSDRRKFFDRIVYNFDSKHAARINAYEKIMQQRSGILQDRDYDAKWLTAIEHKMAEISADIARVRVEVKSLLQKAIDKIDNEFPKAKLQIDGEFEKIIEAGEVDISEYIIRTISDNRKIDAIKGRTSTGVHRSDFVVAHKDKNQLAKFCSTGEQKAMLISLFLAQINIIQNDAGIKPILLLDEIFVHLDDNRRNYLADFLMQSQLQLWITDINKKNIPIRNNNVEEITL